MQCSHHTPTTAADLRSKRRFPAEIEAALEGFFRRWDDVAEPAIASLAEAVRSGDLDPARGGVTAAVERRIGNFANEFDVVFRETVRDGAEAGRRVASRQHNLDIDFDIVPDSTLDELDDFVDDIADDVLDNMAGDVGDELERWHEEGLGPDEIADRVETELFDEDITGHRAERNGRTLVQGSANRGNDSALQDAPGVVGKEWIVTTDGRERDTHAAAGGQIVPVDSTFIVGDERLRHPADPQGAVGEIVNCRCTEVPVFEDELTDDELAQLRAGQRLNVT